MSDLFIDKFATDDELINECLADHITVGMNLFGDVLVLKERIEELEHRLEIDPRHQTDGIEARDETIKGLEAVIVEMCVALERFRTGYQGSCYACEPVGMLNVKLEEELRQAKLLADEWEERYRLCQKLRRDNNNERLSDPDFRINDSI